MAFPPALLASFKSSLERLSSGMPVVVSHIFLDWMTGAAPELARKVRTVQNPGQVGFHDRYLATLAPARGFWDQRLSEHACSEGTAARMLGQSSVPTDAYVWRQCQSIVGEAEWDRMPEEEAERIQTLFLCAFITGNPVPA